MKRITDWVVCGTGYGSYYLRGANHRGREIMTSVIVRVTGRFTCVTKSGSEYLLVGPTSRADVQEMRGDDPRFPLKFIGDREVAS